MTVPVADLRAAQEPAQAGVHDPAQETQLVYGERVRVVRTQDPWAYVEAIEQPEFSHAQRWQGYPGWVPLAALSPMDALRLGPNVVVVEPWAAAFEDAHLTRPSRWRFPMGAHLRATEMGRHLWQVELFDGAIVWLPFRAAQLLEDVWALAPAERRRLIVARAQRFVGGAYYWRGRTAATDALPGQVTGVDCSALVNLAYRAAGVEVPRDAHEQFLRARRVERPAPADLVFLSERGNPSRIVHVMLAAGDGQLLEGPGTGQAVRRIGWVERLGDSPEAVPNGRVVNEQTVSYGAFLP